MINFLQVLLRVWQKQKIRNVFLDFIISSRDKKSTKNHPTTESSAAEKDTSSAVSWKWKLWLS